MMIDNRHRLSQHQNGHLQENDDDIEEEDD